MVGAATLMKSVVPDAAVRAALFGHSRWIEPGYRRPADGLQSDGGAVPREQRRRLMPRSVRCGPPARPSEPDRETRDWLGHTNITIKPVIDLDQVAPVDCYEAPARITEAIRLRHPGDYFPYGTSLSRHQDDEHVIPYVPMNNGGGDHRQATAPHSNLTGGPTCNQLHPSPGQNLRRLDRQTNQTRRLALAHPPRLPLPRRPTRHHRTRQTLTSASFALRNLSPRGRTNEPAARHRRHRARRGGTPSLRTRC